MPLSPGQKVHKYEVVRQLGEGGMGIVYLARDVQLGRPVALKLLHPRKLGSPDAERRLAAEAMAMAQLRNPHIVMIHDMLSVESAQCLVLEYVDGETLRSRLRRKRLALAEVLEIGAAIAKAIAAAHRQGIVHRDLKPENVMIARDGNVYVADFGLAAIVERPDDQGSSQISSFPMTPAASITAPDALALRSHTPRGTPAYMAPEQWRTDAPTWAIDVWALGVILYEMLAGVSPFGGSPDVIQELVCSRSPAPPLTAANGRVPESIAGLVVECLAKDPAMRPAAKTVARRLGNAHLTRGVPVRWRRPLLVGLACTIAAAMVVFFRAQLMASGGSDSEGATSWPPDPPMTKLDVIIDPILRPSPSTIMTARTLPPSASSSPKPMPRVGPTSTGSSAPPSALPDGFDRVAADRALKAGSDAAQVQCNDPDGPHGKVSVAVRFAPEGLVAASVVNAPFTNTPVGRCIERSFRRYTVPRYSGDPVTVSTTVQLR